MLPECHCERPKRKEVSLGLPVQKSQLGLQLPKDWGGRWSGKRKVYIKKWRTIDECWWPLGASRVCSWQGLGNRGAVVY